MSNNKTMKVCPNGHYYEGEECPYCPKVYDKETRLYPGAGSVNIPLCPHCGKPLRKRENINQQVPSDVIVSSVGNHYDGKVPWNYGWNGRCENCGQDYNNIHIVQKLGGVDLGNKHTSVRVDSRSYLYSHTGNTSIVLSGVEIETFVEQRGDTTKQKIFLSTNELKYLLKVLSNSPILKQEDCDVDYNPDDSYKPGTTF